MTHHDPCPVSLDRKTALITGCGSGIGRAMARQFHEAGAQLILVDRDATTLAAVSKETHGDAHVVDLTREEDIRALWKKIESEPDILVNNAGVYPFVDFLKVTADELKKTMDINLTSVFWMCQEFISRRRKQGGIIINVSSIEAILPFKEDLVPYSISKSGVIALTRSLARDYGRQGFQANVILPGAIKTPGTHKLTTNAIQNIKLKLLKTGYDFSTRLALGRWGKPEEVAAVALFLASDLSSYVQGAVLPVDGGFLST